MDTFDHKKLLEMAAAPNGDAEYRAWCQQEDVFQFLESEVADENVLIYASLDHVFLHAVLLPQDVSMETHKDDLAKWSFNPYSGWSIVSNSKDVWVEDPCHSPGCDTLKSATQIVFGRSFDGFADVKNYYEINQKVLQVLDLHFMPERKAWCKLDNRGDIDEIIKIFNFKEDQLGFPGVAITFRAADLMKYCTLEELKLIRMFDFTRYRKSNFHGWGSGIGQEERVKNGSLYMRASVQHPIGSYSRGFQLVDFQFDRSALHKEVWGFGGDEDKQYATFIAHDWKNNRIEEISCDPKCMANYFTESDLPFEVSPAFFRAEVLSKYKADKQKYDLDQRSISCRGAWHLETYDVNEAGQVHTYLIYLSRLPYEEQLHWKQFNEKPKASLSKRAIKTDFEGQWSDEYDSLQSLKSRLRELSANRAPWWVLRDARAIDRVHYPYTASRDEWADEIMNLDQLLVEGFEHKWFKSRLVETGVKPDVKLRALKLCELYLKTINFDADHAYQILSPFHEVHNLRSVVKGHTLGTEAEEESRKALINFGSYHVHFRNLCEKCDESIEILMEAFDAGKN